MIRVRITTILISMFLGAIQLNAKDFHVKDYGAKGDGTTDDGPAIRKTVAAAVAAAPGVKVVFEKKRCRLGRADVNYHIFLKGVKELTIEGNGAELINNPCQETSLSGSCGDFLCCFSPKRLVKSEDALTRSYAALMWRQS